MLLMKERRSNLKNQEDAMDEGNFPRKIDEEFILSDSHSENGESRNQITSG